MSLLDHREATSSLLERTENRRMGNEVSGNARVDFAQFLTPAPVAEFLASLFELSSLDRASLLDPGAGAGSLSAAVADQWLACNDGRLSVTAVEIDETIRPLLLGTLDDLRAADIDSEVVADDFIHWSSRRIRERATDDESGQFDLAVMNPPYYKIGARSPERQVLSALGVELGNIYAAFIALSVRLLRAGGQLVAITPRSFANGPYFKAFRKDLLREMSFSRIHLYDSRDLAFSGDGVLQENVIFHAVKSTRRSPVTISSSFAPGEEELIRTVDHDEVVRPDDEECFVHLTRDDLDANVAARFAKLPCKLSEIDIRVSTGRVVDFRSRDFLRDMPSTDTVPLIYPAHFSTGVIEWPLASSRKSNAIVRAPETESLMLPNGPYVLVKRFSSKEERRRVVAVVADSDSIPGSIVAFENHLNVFHDANKPLELSLARGLAAFLNSTVLDLHFRQWSGHTQVNATDLRSLRYPSREQLTALGEALGEARLEQSQIDQLVATHVHQLGHLGDRDPLMTHQRILEAQAILKELGLPKAQTNERSALTLLALVNLTATRSWTDIEAPLMGITPMMQFMFREYGKQYAPNSRETVRRQSVHQFVAAGLAVINPDDPNRPTNSGDTVYQVPFALIEVLKTYGSGDWDEAVAEWRRSVPGLIEKWARERSMTMIPVTLPNGREVKLTAGGQNPLIKEVVEQFCPRYAPGGQVLYVGDAGDKFVVWEREALASLKVAVGEQGKMPDVVVHDVERGWLLLIEAVTSHGPMDAKRREELSQLFKGSTAGLVYVTAFLDKKTLAKYLPVISWETEVWMSEAPTHLIHFNGSRFLGPYDDDQDAP